MAKGQDAVEILGGEAGCIGLRNSWRIVLPYGYELTGIRLGKKLKSSYLDRFWNIVSSC